MQRPGMAAAFTTLVGGPMLSVRKLAKRADSLFQGIPSPLEELIAESRKGMNDALGCLPNSSAKRWRERQVGSTSRRRAMQPPCAPTHLSLHSLGFKWNFPGCTTVLFCWASAFCCARGRAQCLTTCPLRFHLVALVAVACRARRKYSVKAALQRSSNPKLRQGASPSQSIDHTMLHSPPRGSEPSKALEPPRFSSEFGPVFLSSSYQSPPSSPP